MKNPYEILGVLPSATMDEVKTAYREKARQFCTDQAKMDELNSAYDAIIMNGGRMNDNANSYSNASYNESASTNSDFGDIRAKLNSGRIDDAEMLIDGIPHDRRNAEWYYLKGTIQHRKGWLESALESFERAKELEPDNPEYQAAYNQLHKERKGSFRQDRRENTEPGGCGSPCNICSSLLCADCCCECMGGDLIRCC